MPRTLLVALALFGSVLLAGCHTSPPLHELGLGTWDKPLRTYLTSAPGLVIQNPPTGADSFVANSDLTSGTTGTVAHAQTGATATYSFAMGAPLAQTYYLNLSKPIIGFLYVGNALGPVANHDESARIRAEILQGTARVGGGEFTFNAMMTTMMTTNKPFFEVQFQVRPEVSKLDLGSTLSVRLTRVGGSLDFRIGTGGDHASYFELRYFDVDPLGGVLYLEDGKLVSSALGGSLTPDAGSSAALPNLEYLHDHPALPTGLSLMPPVRGSPEAPAGSALSLVAFLAAPTLGRRRAQVVVFAIVALALSGCAGSSGGIKDTNGTGPVQTGEDENEELKAAGRGAIDGIVTDDTAVLRPIAGADVIILETDNFTKTGTDGRFAFPRVAVGTYDLRFQATGYIAVKVPVTITAGRTIHLNISMKQTPRASNYLPHTHPGWGDAVSMPLADFTFSPPTQGRKILDQEVISNNYRVGDTWYCAPAVGGAWYSANQAFSLFTAYPPSPMVCMIDLPIEEFGVVPPGSGQINLTATWTGGGDRPVRELGLSILTPTNRSQYGSFYRAGFFGETSFDHFVPRPQGDPFHIPFFPSEADPGHARSTQWRYTLVTVVDDLYAPNDIPIHGIGDLRIVATVHKSSVPFEPPHLDLWGTGSQRTAVVRTSHECFYAKLTADKPDGYGPLPHEHCKWDASILFLNQTTKEYESILPIVAPGTKTIQGTLTWDQPGLDAITWKILYRPANEPYDPEDPVYHEATMGTQTSGKATFTIEVKDDEVDGFYQHASAWEYYVDDVDATANVALMNLYQPYFYLEAVAVRDSAFRDA